MSITPSFTLNSTLLAPGSISASIRPFPAKLPLSTFPLPPPNRSFAPPPSPTSSTMPPSGAAPYPHYVNLVAVGAPSSPSSSSVLSATDSSRPTTDTDARGTSLPLSSTSSSNSGISASLTSLSTPSSSSAVLSSSSPPLSALPITVSGFTPTSPVAQSSSSPASSHPTSSLLPSPSTSSFSTTSATTPKPPDSTTTVIVATTLTTSLSLLPSLSPASPTTSTYIITSFVLGQGGTTTSIFTSSVVMSTEPPGSTLDSTLHVSPGTMVGIVLGVAGAFAFAALWLFCARRRHRQLVEETTLTPPVTHASGPLDDEILIGGELGSGTDAYGTESLASQTSPTMEERYAGILAALHLTERHGKGNEGGSTGGVYGSRHDIAADVDDDITRASSPTLPPQPLPSVDSSYPIPLSPPPPLSYQATQLSPPPSAYYRNSRRKSSPGPDAPVWLSGYSAAPSYSSHYARSQTLGSGSASGSVDALSRTRTGSEEPLLGVGRATSEITAGVSTPGGGVSPTATEPGSTKLGFGSAFGSPAASMYTPSSIYPAFQHDSSGSYDVRTVSGTGSYGYARSGTPSSFDILRSVSSQGALSSYSHGRKHSQGFKLGPSRPGSSSSSASMVKKTGSVGHGFGVPPTSFRSWKDWGSTASDKEKQSLKEKEKNRNSNSASISESMDEKHGRGSPVVGVRALLGRLRLGGHGSSHSSIKDLSSPTRSSGDPDPEKAVAATPSPTDIQVTTPQRRRFSFILSNPDPHPPSPYSGAGNVVASTDASPHDELLSIHEKTPLYGSKRVPFGSGPLHPVTPFPTDRLAVPSPAPTEESRLPEGLLHPRLRTQGNSDASLRDFEDYSRPIGGVVKNRLYSTTTFGTQDDAETKSQGGGTPVQDVGSADGHENESDAVDPFGATTPTGVPRESWCLNDPPPSHQSP